MRVTIVLNAYRRIVRGEELERTGSGITVFTDAGENVFYPWSTMWSVSNEE